MGLLQGAMLLASAASNRSRRAGWGKIYSVFCASWRRKGRCDRHLLIRKTLLSHQQSVAVGSHCFLINVGKKHENLWALLELIDETSAL